jgi:hypothetical protein
MFIVLFQWKVNIYTTIKNTAILLRAVLHKDFNECVGLYNNLEYYIFSN